MHFLALLSGYRVRGETVGSVTIPTVSLFAGTRVSTSPPLRTEAVRNPHCGPSAPKCRCRRLVHLILAFRPSSASACNSIILPLQDDPDHEHQSGDDAELNPQITGPFPALHFAFAFSSASRASRSALRRLWFCWNSGAAWLSDIFCLDVSGCSALRSASSATCCSADLFSLLIVSSLAPDRPGRRNSLYRPVDHAVTPFFWPTTIREEHRDR